MALNIFFAIVTISHFMGNYNTQTKIFFHDKGTLATNLSPSAFLKYSFQFKLSETSLNPLKVLFSSITAYLLIVKQYFIFGARNNP